MQRSLSNAHRSMQAFDFAIVFPNNVLIKLCYSILCVYHSLPLNCIDCMQGKSPEFPPTLYRICFLIHPQQMQPFPSKYHFFFKYLNPIKLYSPQYRQCDRVKVFLCGCRHARRYLEFYYIVMKAATIYILIYLCYCNEIARGQTRPTNLFI